MDTSTFLNLARIRYRLQWARARRSRGRRAIFVIVQSIIVLAVIGAAMAGLAGAAAGAATGQTDEAARIILSTAFLNALVASALLGYGMNQVFSDATLRRYPLSARARLVARQGLALVEPLWLVTLALYLGAAIALAALGRGVIWLSLPAVVLLAATNYLLARAIVTVLERAMATSGGQLVVFMVVQVIVFTPITLPFVAERIAAGALVEGLLDATPPLAAAAVVAGTFSVWDVLALIAWPLAAFGALMLADSQPDRRRATSRAAVGTGGAIDWIAARIPGVSPALAAKSLRYYLRNPQIRAQLFLNLPLLTYLVTRFSTWEDPRSMSVAALVMSPLLGAFVTLQMDVNVFGYEGTGVRRLLLSPAPPALVLRAVTVAPMTIGACYIPLVIAAWVLVAPIPIGVRMVIMLACGGLTGLFGLRACAVWASIRSPRRADYDERFKNQTTWAGNVIVVGALVAMAVTGSLAARLITSIAGLLAYWWLAPMIAALSAVFFVTSLRLAEQTFSSRRERLLAVMEGKA